MQHAGLRTESKERSLRSFADLDPLENYAAVIDVEIFEVLFEPNRDAESLRYMVARRPVRT